MNKNYYVANISKIQFVLTRIYYSFIILALLAVTFVYSRSIDILMWLINVYCCFDLYARSKYLDRNKLINIILNYVPIVIFIISIKILDNIDISFTDSEDLLLNASFGAGLAPMLLGILGISFSDRIVRLISVLEPFFIIMIHCSAIEYFYLQFLKYPTIDWTVLQYGICLYYIFTVALFDCLITVDISEFLIVSMTKVPVGVVTTTGQSQRIKFPFPFLIEKE